jgi:adenylate kinase
VPDEVVIGLVGERLAQPDAKAGVVLDGFPRTVAQAEALDALFARTGLSLDRVVYFNVSRDELLRRLTGRRVCRACGRTYHLVSAPPKVADKCDACGGELYQRVDDSEATVATRLDVYRKQTSPLLDYYRGRNLLAEVAGEGSVAEVAEAIRKATNQVVTR